LGEVNKKIAELKEKISGFSGEKDLLFKARAEVNQLEREIGRIEGMLSAPVFRSEPKKAERRFFEVGFVKKFSTLVVDSINEMLSLDSLEAVRGKLTRLKDEAEKYFREDGEVNAVAEEERAKEREKEMEEIKKRRDEISASLEKARGEESRLLKQNEEMISVERELYGRELELSEINGRMRSFAIEEERLKMQKDDFERERAEALAIIKDDSFLSQNFDVLSDEDLDFSSLDGQRRDIERLKIKIEESGGVSEEMVKEFNEIKSRDEFLEKELGDLGKTAESLRDLVKQLEERLTSDFKEGVEKINKEFNNFFGVMFGGGKAELKIISAPKKKKSEDAESAGELLETEAGSGEETAEEEEEREGVDIKVDLPRKRIHSLSMLSGGERALTSIALLFAMSQVNPPPFLILDETDAALDESNSRKYGQMLQSLSGKTQLILVTHNRETMRCAGALFGVTMGNDSISRLLSVKLTEAEGMAGKAKIAEKQEV
jgi:chromosome segregation protein